MIKQTLTLCLLLILAACGGGDDAPLPTVFSVTTAAPAAETAFARTGTPAGETTQAVSANSTLPASWTPTPTPTLQETTTVTPSMTITDTPSPTPSTTPSETPPPSGLLFLAQTAAFSTPLPRALLPTAGPSPTGFTGGGVTIMPLQQSPTPLGGGTGGTPATATSSVTCPSPLPGVFAQATANNPTVLQQVGCPVDTPPVPITRSAAVQPFQNGLMLWTDAGGIYVLYDTGIFQQFADTFDPSVDPQSGGLTPPQPELLEPVRGFGKVWRNDTAIQNGLGWALQAEYGDSASILEMTQGQMIYLPTRGDVLVLTAARMWYAVQI